VSFDTTSALRSWAADEDFEFELWQDTDRTLALHYGAVDSASDWAPDRISVLLDAEGRHIVSYSVSIFGLGDHPVDVLEDCEALFGGR
jgi:peroxiredoxin